VKENSRRKLFVGGLPPSVDEQQLREGFSKYGKVSRPLSAVFVVSFTIDSVPTDSQLFSL